MDTKIAIIAIIVEDLSATEKMNEVLHEYSEFIIGRMGLPYRERNISIISIAIDATNETINALSGKLGNIDGITAKAVFSKV